MEVVGKEKPTTGVNSLNPEQKQAVLHFLDLAELDIEDEVKEHVTEQDEAEEQQTQIEKLRQRILDTAEKDEK